MLDQYGCSDRNQNQSAPCLGISPKALSQSLPRKNANRRHGECGRADGNGVGDDAGIYESKGNATTGASMLAPKAVNMRSERNVDVQAAMPPRLRARSIRPMPPKPRSINAQVSGSGTAPPLIVAPILPVSTLGPPS